MAIEVQTFDDVFDAIAHTPAEAANMKARADLLSAIKVQVESWKIAQGLAAQRLGITRPASMTCCKVSLKSSRSMRW